MFRTYTNKFKSSERDKMKMIYPHMWDFVFINMLALVITLAFILWIHQGPAKQSQHANTTSQHFWAHHVACVWPPCCDVLGHVGCCWLKFETGQIWANNNQHVATRWPNARNMLRPTMLRYVVLACCDRLAGASSIEDNTLVQDALYFKMLLSSQTH